MRFKPHSEVEGRHAILSASKPYWIRDTPEKLLERVSKANAAVLGTKKHELAHMCISLGQKLPSTNQTLNLYVNDCIGYRMSTEVVLFFSYFAFGTADAISFRREADGNEVLRIFDLKTGTGKVTGEQLEVYAALFCLEYGKRPFEIDYDLRIYQNDEVIMFETDPEVIAHIMDRFIEANKLITDYQKEV